MLLRRLVELYFSRNLAARLTWEYAVMWSETVLDIRRIQHDLLPFCLKSLSNRISAAASHLPLFLIMSLEHRILGKSGIFPCDGPLSL